MNKKYSTILFDLDGTIADSDNLLVETFKVLYDIFPNSTRKGESYIHLFSGPPIKKTLKDEFPNDDIDTVFSTFQEISRRFYDGKTVISYPDCNLVLNNLRKMGYKLGVVTNKYKIPSKLCLDSIGLKDVFDIVIAHEDAITNKPLPDGIYLAMKQLNVTEKSKVVYIGDNVTDLQTANNAGIDCIIIDFGQRNLPKDINPKFIVSSYKELERIFI